MRISDWSSDVCSSDLLFVSALRPGQGLWPDDKWPDRNPLFEDDPDTDDLDDFNPNRIFTSKRLKPGEYFYDIKIGRAHVCTPVTNAHLVCRLLLEKKKTHTTPQPSTNHTYKQ